MQVARYHTLDALRGIAAIAVMLFHAGSFSPIPMPGGYLGADLFFVLSGFVLAHGYEDRLRAGMTLGSFAKARLLRIYPVFLLGAGLGLLVFGGSPLTLLMIPTYEAGGRLFEANYPLWSLLFELIVNLAWALLAVRLGLKGLAITLLVLGTLLVRAVLANGDADLGAFWIEAGPGLVRTAFSFGIGVALYRLHRRSGPAAGASARGWVLLAALALVLGLSPANRALFDLAMLGLVIPGIVWLGARWNLRQSGLVSWLGGISFPLYCLHAPSVGFGNMSPQAALFQAIGMIALATLVDRYFDSPIQRWLKGRKQSTCPPREAMI